MDKIRYCVTVDTEEEWDWDSGYPTSSPRTENIRELPAFQQLCESTGSAVVYFTNHAVLANPESRAIMQELARKPKVEIGLHIHPWNTPPLANVAMVSPRDSYLHNLPWPEAEAKLKSVLEVFDQAGLKPTSYRGGRYSTSNQIQEYLFDHGLWVDCSILPYNRWRDEGSPDYRNRDQTPVRKSVNKRSIWELPLSFGVTRTPISFWMGILKLADTQVGRVCRATGILDRTGIASRAWLNFENPNAGDVLRYLDVMRRIRPPFVSFTLHSSSLMLGGSPYSRSKADIDRTIALTKSTLQTVAKWPEFQPATVTEIAQHLESLHASSRNQSTG